MSFEINEKYMERALRLARCGLGYVSPNPMVGAVIVTEDGRIIGEGYHRKFGGPHAEVNAIASVSDADRHLLCDSTMYVTLEPCSHYGKTPPCAKLIIDSKIPRVAVGASDPNPKVSGRGIAMLREAGINVAEGILSEECRNLNMTFATAHENNRPFVTLKWAQSADGFVGAIGDKPYRFSTDITSVSVHYIRSLHDAILIGSGTAIADNPRLDVRLYPSGRTPRAIVLDRRGRISQCCQDMAFWQSFASNKVAEPLIINNFDNINDLLSSLFKDYGITSVLVEGGAEILHSFIESGIWDLARIEVCPRQLGDCGCVCAPSINSRPVHTFEDDGNTINLYSRNPLIDVKNL